MIGPTTTYKLLGNTPLVVKLRRGKVTFFPGENVPAFLLGRLSDDEKKRLEGFAKKTRRAASKSTRKRKTKR